MKNFIFPLMLCVTVLAGCAVDDERVFPETAAVRANQAVADAYSTLTASSEGWKMTYFPNPSLYGGYQFLFKFNNQNRVEMGCDLGANVQTSSYRIDLSQGPLLVFDTYSYIHLLAEPRTTPVPTGLGGDYEFMITELTPDKVTLLGRKRGHSVVMERATAQDWTNLAGAFSVQNLCALQDNESWQLAINGEKKQGELVLDVLRHNFTITCGSSNAKGTYSASATELIFDSPATIVIDDEGTRLTFNGFKIERGTTDADRKIVSADPASTLVFSVKLNIPVTVDNIATYMPDPDVNAIDAFLNLKNTGSVSRYRMTLMSPMQKEWHDNLRINFPAYFDFCSIEAPRSTYDLSVIFNSSSGTVRYYCNGGGSGTAGSGFIPMTGEGRNPLYDVYINVPSGSTIGSPPAEYTTDTDFVNLRTFFRQATGFTVIRDGTSFWFRSIADPNEWFKCEPY